MRRTISVEGTEEVPGVIIEKGALGWPDEPLPVCWNFQHDLGQYGTASDIRREDDGRVTAEIELFDITDAQKSAKMTEEHGDLVFTTWANELVERREGRVRMVSAARIRSVNMVIAGLVGWD